MALSQTLPLLQPLRGAGHEVVLIDGGSCDGTCEIAWPLVDALLSAQRGRAHQMNAGAAIARGEVLLFLHADTCLPEAASECVCEALRHGTALWGRFDVRPSGQEWWARMIEFSMNLRSRLSGIATGDQAIFVRRDTFWQVGGFPRLPLMEDIAISRRLKRFAPPACLRARVTTSSRRWAKRGWLRTVALMWALRLAYAVGVSPTTLARIYYPEQSGASRHW